MLQYMHTTFESVRYMKYLEFESSTTKTNSGANFADVDDVSPKT